MTPTDLFHAVQSRSASILPRERFQEVNQYLQTTSFPFDLSKCFSRIQRRNECFDEAQNFVKHSMLAGLDHQQIICRAEIQPPNTVDELNQLLNFGPTLLFGPGLPQSDSLYDSHAWVLIAMLNNWIDNEPHLLIYDCDDTIMSRRETLLRFFYRHGICELEELTPEMINEAGLSHLFYRVVPAWEFVTNFQHGGCSARLVTGHDEAGASTTRRGAYKVCLQYIQPQKTDKFATYYEHCVGQPYQLATISLADQNL